MATYTITWAAEGDEPRTHEVEASSEQEARARFKEYLKTRYEDDYKDDGIKVLSVVAK
jgi:hypothetical protein